MVTRSVKGVMRGGKVELIEHVDAVDGTEVTVYVPEQPEGEARMMTYGMFAKPGRPQSTPEDFQEAKKFLEREWERSWDRLEKE